MNKNKNKLSLVNFDTQGNQTIIRAKYNFIIKILSWLGKKNYIEIEYVNRKIKLEVTSTPTGIVPIRIKKIVDKVVKKDIDKKIKVIKPPLKNNSKKITKKINAKK